MKEYNSIFNQTHFRDVGFFDGQSDLADSDVLRCAGIFVEKIGYSKDSAQQGICILVERSSHYIALMFAAWRCGLYVVPLNTAWPLQKNIDIIHRINPVAVIVDDDFDCEKIPDFRFFKKSELFDDKKQFSENESNFRPLRPSDLAYVIFTSGSTGEPKGVVISAGAFRSYIDWTKRYFSAYSDSKRLLLTSELTFDITMGDIAFALAFGTQIGIARHNTNIPSVLAMIMRHKIDVLYSVPTTHLALTGFAKMKRGADLSSIKLILSGGDRFPWQLVHDYSALTNGAHFYNVYGPTEVTINCFAIRLDNKHDIEEKGKGIPIGECFDSLDFVLINDEGLPDNTGELCVTGPQMMMGYHGDPELTARAFINDPRQSFISRKLYRTGDLGFIDDNLVFLKGRIDGLIKIRGYRIHPDEVSKAIDSLDGVEVSAVVAVGDQSNATLVAFVRSNSTSELNEKDISHQLSKILPTYMQPSSYIFVNGFPLNQSGKIDKKALLRSLEK